VSHLPASKIEASPLERTLTLVAHGATDVGRVRRANEDGFSVLAHLGLFMVADGMGGAAAGEVASRMLVENVSRAVEDGETTWPADAAANGPESTPRRFLSGVHRANRRIYALSHADARKRGMGSTFAGVLVLDRCVMIAHVGDSRVYRLRDGQLEQLTADHSLANEYVKLGLLKVEQIDTFSRRNVITRAVGIEESVEVDVKIVDVRPGDVLLLCTDGLHGELRDREIAPILRTLRDPEEAVARLIERANARGGGDNVTAVVVRIDEPSA
jgi:serine/threonine protein phosphatase PrpC